MIKMQSLLIRCGPFQRIIPLVSGGLSGFGRNIASRSLTLSSASTQARSSGVGASGPGEKRHNKNTQKRTVHGVAKQQTFPDAPEIPPCDHQPNKYEGMSYEDARQVRNESINPALFTYYRNPVMLHHGKMQWLWDVAGKRYLDLFGGIVTVSVGHCHPHVTDALVKQAHNLWHTTNIYMHPAIHQYAKDLRAKLPEHLNVIYFVNSGTDANDMAVQMARMYTGSYDVISFRNAYHGASPNLLGLTAMSSWIYPIPSGFGMRNTMNADCYRGLWGGKFCRDSPVQTDRDCDCTVECKAKDLYLEQYAEVLRYSTGKKIAGFFAEGIQGVGGTVQYPKGLLAEMYKLTREKGGVCISDEVQTGFGRLGSHFWGFESHGIMPDIVTMAKGIGNGFPLGAVVTTSEIAATMKEALHFNTYGGNPLSCAVGSAVLEVIDNEGLQANSENVGTHLLLELAKLRDEFEVVGDVRGKGLMIGMEMVADKETRAPLPPDEMMDIWEDTKEMGLLIGKGGFYGQVFRIKPPMCITKDDADFTVAVIRQALLRHRDRQAKK
ncbi:alanine--glyoxylate aminotransferase 2, mitochondrial-like [Lytechinus pictus]|uniref:alanine--glyoxylate aminotransferase 2, mitochondrial-like n=1 Tax=Lytechinus pictus TaxID=7653 RepID=UPI00240DC8D6|nr:alanine--glyoxylate aminotransferase 2, mitochondrial-like [Lytechinus pictus]